MSAHRVAATGALLVALVSAPLGWSTAASSSSSDTTSESAVEPAASVSVRTSSRQRVRLEALPQIVQHGAEGGRRRCGEGRDHRHAAAGARRASGPAAGAAGIVLGRRDDRPAGRARPGAVRLGRVAGRHARDVPREAPGLGRAGRAEERPGEHRAVAAADVDRRVHRLRAAPGVAPPRPGLRALQPPLLLEGRPAGRERRGRGAAAQRHQGPGRHDAVPDRRARRGRPGASPTASTGTSARRASSPSATASRRRG